MDKQQFPPKDLVLLYVVVMAISNSNAYGAKNIFTYAHNGTRAVRIQSSIAASLFDVLLPVSEDKREGTPRSSLSTPVFPNATTKNVCSNEHNAGNFMAFRAYHISN